MGSGWKGNGKKGNGRKGNGKKGNGRMGNQNDVGKKGNGKLGNLPYHKKFILNITCRLARACLLQVTFHVCLSVTRVDCDKTVERSVQIYIPYERTFSLVF